MGVATRFKTPNGEDMVILSQEDYEALVEAAEMLEDVAAYDRFKEKLAKGEEELIPAEFVYRMMDGESPVRVWRDFRGLSAKDLAATAGISATYLSEIESKKKEGSISSLKKIARALKVDLEDLVAWSGNDEPDTSASREPLSYEPPA
ncbi:helix-turn-helix transcriptional regulator [Ciceribacter sp. L1K22]|uniref:helix-turn-helix domain-containing protein n=1 Tax=Ciceribacter sp. L1K22 TaxID=2820275 RepID=UPI001ABDBDB8|nr:helix-turn-helix transcriptional regulator [Ciceribacter sp. L1K22]MBO3761129.1 helix-turn-helix transcriptional regulator [Ciceribacter sp. L1K22]